MTKLLKFLTSILLFLGSVVLLLAVVEERKKDLLVFDDVKDEI